MNKYSACFPYTEGFFAATLNIRRVSPICCLGFGRDDADSSESSTLP